MARNFLACILLLGIALPNELLPKTQTLKKHRRDKILKTPTIIKIDTKEKSVHLNGVKIMDLNIQSITQILGKFDRTKTHQYDSYIEEFPLEDGDSPSIYPIKITDYYYIYDRLGIMLYTSNGEEKNKKPSCMAIFFGNKRLFTHQKEPHYKPRNPFTGELVINGNHVSAEAKILPTDVDYRSRKFERFGLLFSPTSIAMMIDSLYSEGSEPYMQLFLDNQSQQRLSYFKLFL
ncbi:hypothetical protein CH373_15625 [Leptospira perolatii]|uniref:DUF7738 domain-containing protein n=1 Tax=Leptospira perolatii TaxID=2023191 RepID=A0A2M9ZJK9_9LEPT|nr:hypothetical protein [Leptospira perolatii]PJZ68843.1 hypothetical protein CH360_14085 [Leptospira perolatii]PJZ72174.1 hypothetical protein CH373_15625 [Leptospira perolatii]